MNKTNNSSTNNNKFDFTYINNIKDDTERKYKYEALQTMILNTSDMSDTTFNSNNNLIFVAEEYVYDDIPVQYKFINLQDALIYAYYLYMFDKLHSIGIYNKRTKEWTGTDVLNYFSDIRLKEVIKQNKQLEKEVNQYKEFLKLYHAEDSFKKFQESNK